MAYALAVILPLAMLALRMALTEWLEGRPGLILFVIPMILSAYVGGLGPGLLSTVVVALTTAYYVMPPFQSFAFGRPLDLVQWLVLLLTGVLITLVSEQLHRARRGGEQAQSDPKLSAILRRVQGSFGFALTVLGLIAVGAWLSVMKLRTDAEMSRHSNEVIAHLESLLSTATDAETGARGYIITGDESFLDPYQRALGTSEDELRWLREATSDNPAQQQRLSTLTPLIATRMEVAGSAIEQRRNDGFAAARNAIADGSGKQLHDQIRQLLSEMKAAELDLLVSRDSQSSRSAAVTQTIILVGGVLAFALVWLSMFAVRRDFAGRQQAEAALRGTNDQLEARVAARTAELVHANESLSHSERRSRAILEHSADSIALVDAENRILYMSPAVQSVEGFTPEELIGRNGTENTHPDDLPLLDGYVQRLVAHPGQPVPVLWRRQHKDGRWLWLEGVATNLLHDPAVGAIVTNYRDVTERKRAEEAIRDSEEHFRFLNELAESTRRLADPGQIMSVMTRMLGRHLGASRCAYADVDKDGEKFNILHDYTDGCASTVGSYRLSLFGARAVATLQHGQTLIIRDVDRELLPGSGADMFNAIGIKAIITCPLVKDGVLRAMMAVHQSMPRDWKPPEIAIVREVVERCWATIQRRAAEEQVQQLNVELEERVSMRTLELEAANLELEAFSYSISHDLRAPLRAVDGFAQAVVEDFAPLLPAEGQRQLNVIRASAQFMGRLIDDLLSFSRLGRQALTKQTVQTEMLVRAVLTSLQAERTGREIEIDLGDLPPCQGDPALLKQVWTNLLSNALKYTGKREHPTLTIGSTEQAGERVFFVRDNGAGFDMRYSKKLFGVFQRLHRSEEFEGTGVGLAIVQRIIHRHGGRVWAEAEPDHGATFFFTLAGAPSV
ncbi:MAG TPA: CHASE3 domain-containing protein [Planctomycetota bacterium]|nr:CHASE3 domain-containing protein [Planctomycetota bacterium]